MLRRGVVSTVNLVFLSSVVLLISNIATAQSVTWTTKAPMPTPRNRLGVGVVDGILYAIGGNAGSLGFVGTVEAYNPATNSWTTETPMPTPRADLGVGVVDGILYAVGGYTGINLDTVEAYDPATNSWTTKAPMPTPRAALAVAVVNGILYAIGGFQAGAALGTVEAYDPATNSWTTKASMPNPLVQFSAGVVDGIVYAIGSTGLGRRVQAYNPATNSWTFKAPMPTNRVEAAGAVLHHVFYSVGGVHCVVSDCTIVGTLEAYDPATDSWTTETPMPTPRFSHAAGALNDRFYAIGGNDSFWTIGGGLVEAFSVIRVQIDIKPGSFPNSINLGSYGNVPVAILSSPTFDATRVDPLTVTLAGAAATLKGKGTPMVSVQDVDGDGLLDLVVHVSTEALQMSDTDTQAILKGQTFDDQAIRGMDTVRVVP